MTILIVDDNCGVRRLIRNLTREVASQIWDCADGSQAVTAYAQYRPDVVLMDIQMPGVDGLVATRQILGVDPSARIIIVTAYDDDAFRAAAANAGAQGYALKTDLLELVQLLRSIGA